MAPRKSKNQAAGGLLAGVPEDQLTGSQKVALAVLASYGDLAPSVKRILEAELSEDERHRAMVLFQASLTGSGDPNRDPRKAILNSREAATSD
ncbi:MAG: hypothetical protein IT196_15305 [Acidimicrobiales bacterium]|nr:hypothetical protein [Acidimicrobiales bacterium]